MNTKTISVRVQFTGDRPTQEAVYQRMRESVSGQVVSVTVWREWHNLDRGTHVYAGVATIAAARVGMPRSISSENISQGAQA